MFKCCVAAAAALAAPHCVAAEEASGGASASVQAILDRNFWDAAAAHDVEAMEDALESGADIE